MAYCSESNDHYNNVLVIKVCQYLISILSGTLSVRDTDHQPKVIWVVEHLHLTDYNLIMEEVF